MLDEAPDGGQLIQRWPILDREVSLRRRMTAEEHRRGDAVNADPPTGAPGSFIERRNLTPHRVDIHADGETNAPPQET